MMRPLLNRWDGQILTQPAPDGSFTVPAMALKSAGGTVSGRDPGSAPQRSISSAVARPRSALRKVLRRWEKAAATTAANAGLIENAGVGRTERRATADHTCGGGWKAPGPTSNNRVTSTHGDSMTVRRPYADSPG